MIELNPYIILSKPQLGENIGSTARAMKNFGVKNLFLVQPRDGWPNNSAFATAAGITLISLGSKVDGII